VKIQATEEGRGVSKPRLKEAAVASQSYRKKGEVASQKTTKPGLWPRDINGSILQILFGMGSHTKIQTWQSPLYD